MSLADEAMVVNRPGGLAFINDGMGTNEVCSPSNPTTLIDPLRT
jgi:hypothetical protein